ncbi:MAG: hypothetical protein M1588_00600, partial [Planctomycetes bacterium]|nr:hypothetical protein [Planctomycetota bacterium]
GLCRVASFGDLFQAHRDWTDRFLANPTLSPCRVALLGGLVQWNGLKPDDHGFVRLSIAGFSF